MKVLSVMPAYYPATELGGPISSVHNLNKKLVLHNIDVSVITTDAMLRDKVQNLKWYEIDGVKVIYTKYSGSVNFTFSIQFIKELLKVIKSVEVIHINGIWNFPILISLLFSKLKHKPTMISPRGALYEESVSSKKRRLKMSYFYLILKHLLKSAEMIHFTSEFDKERFLSFTGLKNDAVIIPNGIDVEEFSFNENDVISIPELSGKEYICYLGRINHIKGLELLIKAFKKVNDVINSLYLVIAGPDESEYSLTLEKLINELNLKDKIIFTGALDQKDKVSLLKYTRMMVLPSRSENFGNVVLEALACKVPVIISNKVGVYREIEKSNSGLICELDPESIYNCIITLNENKELRQKIVENGFNLVKNEYSLDLTVNKFINTYQVLKNKRA